MLDLDDFLLILVELTLMTVGLGDFGAFDVCAEGWGLLDEVLGFIIGFLRLRKRFCSLEGLFCNEGGKKDVLEGVLLRGDVPADGEVAEVVEVATGAGGQAGGAKDFPT